MSFLTDGELEEILSTDTNCSDLTKLVISPYDEDSMTAIGYDLRVGSDYYTLAKKGANHATDGAPIILLPNSTTLISTLENIQMPKNRLYAGLIESKVKKVSLGLSHISTTIDPDWSGHLLIAVHNHTSEKIELEYKDKFCTIIFVKNNAAPKKTSRHSGGRADIITELFSSINIDAKIQENQTKLAAEQKLQKMGLWIPPSLVAGFSIIGAFIASINNNNNYLFNGIVATGVALAIYASKYYEVKK
jgi:deoxycytidine triphosphate deaminase